MDQYCFEFKVKKKKLKKDAFEYTYCYTDAQSGIDKGRK